MLGQLISTRVNKAWVPVASCLLWAVLCAGTAASAAFWLSWGNVGYASLPHALFATLHFQPHTVFILASSKSNCTTKTMKPIVCICAVTASPLRRLIWIKFSAVCVDRLPLCRVSCYVTAFLLQTKLCHLHLLAMMSSTSLNKHLCIQASPTCCFHSAKLQIVWFDTCQP